MHIVMGLIMLAFLAGAFLSVFSGLDSLTQATKGVGLICAGVFSAILARMAQASGHHIEVMRALRTKETSEGRASDFPEPSIGRNIQPPHIP